METTKIYTFEYNDRNKTKITVDAVSEESARRKVMRRRNNYRQSWASANGAKLLNVEGTVDENKVKQILEGLKRETVSFKEEYLQRMKTFITNHFNHMVETYGEYGYNDWAKEFGEDKKMYRSEETYRVISRKGEKMRTETNKFNKLVKENKKGEYIQSEVNKYSKDFDNKLTKLAGRMDKKGFGTKLEVTSKHVGVNFDCWVTDGENTAHAYTIIASGPIQRPHYRYLVK